MQNSDTEFMDRESQRNARRIYKAREKREQDRILEQLQLQEMRREWQEVEAKTTSKRRLVQIQKKTVSQITEKVDRKKEVLDSLLLNIYKQSAIIQEKLESTEDKEKNVYHKTNLFSQKIMFEIEQTYFTTTTNEIEQEKKLIEKQKQKIRKCVQEKQRLKKIIQSEKKKCQQIELREKQAALRVMNLNEVQIQIDEEIIATKNAIKLQAQQLKKLMNRQLKATGWLRKEKQKMLENQEYLYNFVKRLLEKHPKGQKILQLFSASEIAKICQKLLKQ